MKSTSFRFSFRLARLLLACVACTQVAAAPCHAPAGHGTSQWRPALHYTPQRNWMNDPNGLVYDNGRY
ncbi:MAG: glycoside hydrolase family 32 protein, partial [Burkholderia sp.]|nr:glycoside hydrolase family 32 protein [Burkholderia sp.]